MKPYLPPFTDICNILFNNLDICMAVWQLAL